MEVYDITKPEQTQNFRVIKCGTPKGIFYLFRCLWQTSAEGKQWQVVAFTLLLLALMPFAFVLDILTIVILILWHVLKVTAKSIYKLFITLIEKLFTKVIYPIVKFSLQIAVVIALIFILIYKFEYVKNLVLNLFEYLTK